jgi:hypothetical protein
VQVESVCKIVFPIVFLLFNVGYWPAILVGYFDGIWILSIVFLLFNVGYWPSILVGYFDGIWILSIVFLLFNGGYWPAILADILTEFESFPSSSSCSMWSTGPPFWRIFWRNLSPFHRLPLVQCGLLARHFGGYFDGIWVLSIVFLLFNVVYFLVGYFDWI